MTIKVLTKKTFINGALYFPGDEVEIDANEPTGYAPAGSSPVGSLTDEQLEAELARRARGSKSKPRADDERFSDNVATPNATNTGSIPMNVADIAPRSAGTTQPQGLPPGAEQVGNRHLLPAAEDAPGAVQEIVGGQDALPTVGVGDQNGNGNLTKAEIVAELKARNIDYDANAKRDDLYALLATPPKA